MNNNDKENQIIEINTDETPESVNKLTVVEYLGRDWKKYFMKPETLQEIIRVAAWQRNYQRKLRNNSEMSHDFISISSITDLGIDRQKMIVLLREIRRGLNEKWIFDITSTSPSWDQILDALYCSEEDCAGVIILYCEDLMKRYSNEPEIRLDYWTRYMVLFKIIDYSRTIFPIYATVHNELIQENHFAFCFNPMPANLSSHRRKKPPARLDFESFIWELYYQEFLLQVIKKGHKSQLINDQYHDPEVPFSAMPLWTGKGLFMRIEIIHDCPEIARLVLDKKEELARHYPGCIMQVRMKSGRPYRIDIQLHDAPVHDFIESSPLAKYNYALEIHKQELDLIGHLEEIFQGYMPESK